MKPFLIFFVLLFGLLATGCATTKSTGIRPGIHPTKIKSLALFPVFSITNYSIESNTFEEIRMQYEHALTITLSKIGFQLIKKNEIYAPLSLAEKQSIEDGLALPRPLETLFELEDNEEGTEIPTLRKFNAAKILPQYLLFAEIVYFSHTICRQPAKEYSNFSKVNNSEISLPAECILSNLHLKLVDSTHGKTMWENRLLFEFRSESAISNTEIDNVIRETVRRTLTEESGILQFR